MRYDDVVAKAGAPPVERRAKRSLGHLVSLNGMHGVIACDMQGSEPGDYWSVGNLISVVHDRRASGRPGRRNSLADQRWKRTRRNIALVKIELTGEILDERRPGVLSRHPLFSDARLRRPPHPRRRPARDLRRRGATSSKSGR